MAAVVLLVAVLLVLLWPATTWWVEHVDGVRLHGKGALTGADRQEALDKARGRITAVATGLLAAVAIYYTASNASSARQTARAAQESVQAALRAADHTDKAQRRTHELTERGQLTDRFTAAVAQLGDTNPAIQLGGVHALAGIADDAPARSARRASTSCAPICASRTLPTPDLCLWTSALASPPTRSAMPMTSSASPTAASARYATPSSGSSATTCACPPETRAPGRPTTSTSPTSSSTAAT
ncbi:hypothetical protein [Actinomadura sp. NPDC048394]|uniref:hypothetical protein n=1 Tax=Actinomadura sp. NPDC048394 TaxID=3158223 RepID=UPI0033E06CBD